ncbi:phage portal protein [Bacillus sp. FSL W8-0223]|uniref:phage portal protein n=1 Tax=Bacillus sp. FSL W8-0223 TaxID=2954595 RepID=UPI0030F72581
MNVFDKTIEVFAPNWALKRAAARKKLNVLNQGYGNHGASTKKKSLLGWISSPGSALEDIEFNIEKLRERSRDLYMGAPLATGALKTLRTNVIGAGLKLNAQIDYEYLGMTLDEADQWESMVEREFALWAESINCDAQRMNNFYELQQLAFLSWIMSGDCFVLLPIIPRPGMPYDLRVQIIEADRVCNPDRYVNDLDYKIVNGVEINDIGEIVAYHIAKNHPNSVYMTQNSWTRVEKFGAKTGRPNVLHLMESERPEQRRGVPILAPVIESLKQLSRYTEAELMAAVISGMYTVFITTETKQGEQFNTGIAEEDLVDEEDDGSIELGNGTIVYLGENEKVQESNPGRPNTAFDGFVSAICRQIGAALEIPYELLMKNFTASYSASRGALLEAWKMFRMRREWMANDFCQPIYEEFLAEAIAKGRIYAPGFFTDPLARKAYSMAEWHGPSQGQLDPLKEVTAAEKRVENGFSTRTRETVELTGGNFFKNNNLRVLEEKVRRDGGLIPTQNGSTSNVDPSQNPDDEGVNTDENN